MSGKKVVTPEWQLNKRLSRRGKKSFENFKRNPIRSKEVKEQRTTLERILTKTKQVFEGMELRNENGNHLNLQNRIKSKVLQRKNVSGKNEKKNERGNRFKSKDFWSWAKK